MKSGKQLDITVFHYICLPLPEKKQHNPPINRRETILLTNEMLWAAFDLRRPHLGRNDRLRHFCRSWKLSSGEIGYCSVMGHGVSHYHSRSLSVERDLKLSQQPYLQ